MQPTLKQPDEISAQRQRDQEIGKNVKRRREARGMSQTDLADAMTARGIPGIGPAAISKIENGSRRLLYAEGVEIERILGIPDGGRLDQLDYLQTVKLQASSLVDEIEKAIETANGSYNNLIQCREIAASETKKISENQGAFDDPLVAQIKAIFEDAIEIVNGYVSRTYQTKDKK